MTPLIKFAEKFVSFDNRADGRSTTMTAGRRRGGARRDEKFAQDCAQEARDGGMVGEKREKKNRRDKGEEKYSYRGYNCILDYE